MPNHRFLAELTELENLQLLGQRNTLVIGTFNASDQEGLDNDARWFYGRKENEFWYLFPQIMGFQSLHQRENPHVAPDELARLWKTFCNQNAVLIVDVYKSINGNLPNHGDEAIENPEQYVFFDYKRAFQQIHFTNVLFTWKGRTRKHLLGRRKEEIHNWFSQRGSRILHMITPSYAYPKRKEIKLESWRQQYHAQ